MQHINLNPSFWGPKAWYFIDSIILSLPENIILDQKIQTSIRNFLFSLQDLLPCEKCRIHYADYISQNYLDCTTKQNILIWINNLHNLISSKNNKKQYTINDMYEYYGITPNINNTINKNYVSSFYNISILIFLIIIFLLIIKYLHS